MALTTLAIVLGAATIHAFWNLVIARADDTAATLAVALVVGVVAAVPFAVLRWHVLPEAWLFVALSSAIELVYFWVLITAYQRAEISLVYPVARGMAPVIVLIVSTVALGVTTSVVQAAGVGIVGFGVLLVRGLRGGARWSDVGLAVAVAAFIAAYTLVDKEGVRYADPVTYVTLILVVPAIAAVALIAARGGTPRLLRALNRLSVLGGLASISAYGLVLFALTMAPAASVAAVREVSVVVAVVFGALFLRERVGPMRLIGSVVVVLGVALVVAG